MEAISKQRFDAPPSSVPGRGGGAAARRTRAAHPQPQARHDARLAARLGALRGQAAAAVQQQQQQQQRQVAPAAASPNRPLQGDRAVPQGSIQSGMAVTGRRGEGASGGWGRVRRVSRPLLFCCVTLLLSQQGVLSLTHAPAHAPTLTPPTDSDSEGSTRARGPTKHRRSQHRASGRDGSVEQPQRQPGLQHAAPAGLAGSALAARRASQAAAVLAAEEPAAVAAGVADAAGPSHPVSRGRKRSASAAAGEARPSKRQQRAQEQQPQGKQVEEQEAVVEQPQQRQKRQEPRRGTRTGLRSSGPAASAEQQQHPQQQQQQPAVAEAAGTAHPQQQQLQAKEAGGVVAAATVGVPAKPEGASEVSGSYHEAQAGSVEELEQSPEGQEVAQQLQRVAVAAGRRSREGQRQRDPLHAVVGFVKSLVWGPASSERLP